MSCGIIIGVYRNEFYFLGGWGVGGARAQNLCMLISTYTVLQDTTIGKILCWQVIYFEGDRGMCAPVPPPLVTGSYTYARD